MAPDREENTRENHKMSSSDKIESLLLESKKTNKQKFIYMQFGEKNIEGTYSVRFSF